MAFTSAFTDVIDSPENTGQLIPPLSFLSFTGSSLVNVIGGLAGIDTHPPAMK
jgi:hypothetical protein